MLGDDVAGFILIGTLVLGVLGCIVQWRRLKGKTANGANTEHKTTVSENTDGAFAPAEKASIQNPFVREIKENWGLLLAPIVVTLFWNLWGSRLLWTLFPSMYNYDFLPQTLWHYMPSIITAILSGWEMATFIVAIKTRSKNFCILWMLPNMIIALVYLVKMFRLLTTYGGLHGYLIWHMLLPVSYHFFHGGSFENWKKPLLLFPATILKHMYCVVYARSLYYESSVALLPSLRDS